MESSEDKHWAHKALIDPLNEPEPNAETGPGTHFRRPESDTSSLNSIPIRSASTSSKLQKKSPYRDSTSASNNPYRKSSSASKNPFVSEKEVQTGRSRGHSYPSPPPSASPRRDQFSHRSEAFGQYSDTPPSPAKENNASAGRPRGSSLGERFPGDKSHKPLEVIKQEQRAAHRAPHLRKKHQIRPDTIDSLDIAGGNYHHEGPFDATYYARNSSFLSSPLGAVADSNEEALKATPREKILDAVERHRPLDGVASYAPGQTDRNGQTYSYRDGENMMVDLNPEGGAYKRYPGVQYHPDDIKGKGEPSFTIERQLKEQKNHRREMADGIEMTTQRPRSSGHEDLTASQMWGDGEASSSNVRRSNTTGKDEPRRSGGSIRRRFGSIRRSLGGKKDE